MVALRQTQQMADGRPVEPYFTVLTRAMALEDETILAWGMNEDSGYQDMDARI
jgi:DMSO/TMAO reductase YedYZ molybdopterin-dependent catalytic subunit